MLKCIIKNKKVYTNTFSPLSELSWSLKYYDTDLFRSVNTS